MAAASPFHAGEQAVQRRLGVRDEIEPWARRVVRPVLPEQHRAFYAQLPFLVLAARDRQGQPWATLVTGAPGFARSPDPATLDIAGVPALTDALGHALQTGDDVGILGIELHTRRRNRVNGRIRERGSGGLTLSVEQSFGNCPQHITPRRWRRADTRGERRAVAIGARLSEADQRWIAWADTFFIASGVRGDAESHGMDASHRGGAPGFVRVESPRTLVFPDYAGNNHFNTLGNLTLDPRAGLLFVDFERGHLLQLSGRAEIDWSSPDIARFPGARRLVRFQIERVRRSEHVLPLRFGPAPETHALELMTKERESADVTSFVFAARDGAELPPFRPGQHLPLEIEVPGQPAPVLRTYSLSGPSDGSTYRISVKREPHGLVSGALHDTLQVGDVVSAGTPQGDFTLDPATERPVVLVSAGVGLTPLVSMLHALAGRSTRPVWFVHGARDGRHHPLRREVEELVGRAANVTLHVAYSRPGPMDALGRDHQSVGRVDVALLETLLPGLDADFYLCGPRGFMAAIEEGLDARGVPHERIRSESFGPDRQSPSGAST